MKTLLLLAAPLLQDTSLEADAGFGGVVLPDAWARVTAVVKHAGATVEAELRIGVWTRGTERTAFRRTVTLAAPSHRVLTWDVHLTGTEDAVTVELVGPRGRALARQTVNIRFVRDQARHVLQACEPARSLAFPRELEGVAVARTDPERLPADAVPLLGVDAIVFPEPARLDAAQEEALLRWVGLGGKLVFFAGRAPAALRQGMWRELCPLEGAGQGSVTVRSGEVDATVPLTTGTLREGSVFLTLGGRPAAVRMARGFGEVVFLAFLPDQAGLEEGASSISLWREILRITPPREIPIATRRRRQMTDHTSLWSVLRRVAPAPPGVMLLSMAAGGFISCAYVVTVGPLEYLRLRRRRRLARGWRSFLVIAAVFSIVMLLWGGSFWGRPTQVRHLGVADEGMIRTYSLVRAGNARIYGFESAGTVSPINGWLPFDAGESEPESVAEGGSRLRIPMPILSERRVASTRVPAPGELGVSCRWTDARAGLEVVNDGPLHLKGCVLVSRDQVHRLGEIAPRSRPVFLLNETPAMGFSEWTAAWGRRDPELWAWSGGFAWSYIRPEHQPLGLSLFESLQDEERRSPLDVRKIDLTAVLERGLTVFLGAFDADVTGLRLDQDARVEVRGVLRLPVGEGKR